MRARVKFTLRDRFNYPNRIFALPVKGGDVPPTMSCWTMCFQADHVVGPLEYLGEAKWLARPFPAGELRPGFRFSLYDGVRIAGEGIIL